MARVDSYRCERGNQFNLFRWPGDEDEEENLINEWNDNLRIKSTTNGSCVCNNDRATELKVHLQNKCIYTISTPAAVHHVRQIGWLIEKSREMARLM